MVELLEELAYWLEVSQDLTLSLALREYAALAVQEILAGVF